MKTGTIFRNQNNAGVWSEYLVTALTDRMFEFNLIGTAYHVRYTLTPIDEHSSKVVYLEWVDEGEIDGPFTLGTLKKLKKIIEG